MAVTRDDLGRAARKRGIEGQETIIRHFGIRCMNFAWFIQNAQVKVTTDNCNDENIFHTYDVSVNRLANIFGAILHFAWLRFQLCKHYDF